jgi:hypothetical protein
MTVATARISATVNWCFLLMFLRKETREIREEDSVFENTWLGLQGDLLDLLLDFEKLETNLKQLAEDLDDLKTDLTPVCDDAVYTLCGDRFCDGGCRICVQGEYAGEEEEVEKYCRRGRR